MSLQTDAISASLDALRTLQHDDPESPSVMKILNHNADGGYTLHKTVPYGWTITGGGINEPVTLTICEVLARDEGEEDIEAADLTDESCVAFALDDLVYKRDGNEYSKPSGLTRVWEFRVVPTGETHTEPE